MSFPYTVFLVFLALVSGATVFKEFLHFVRKAEQPELPGLGKPVSNPALVIGAMPTLMVLMCGYTCMGRAFDAIVPDVLAAWAIGSATGWLFGWAMMTTLMLAFGSFLSCKYNSWLHVGLFRVRAERLWRGVRPKGPGAVIFELVMKVISLVVRDKRPLWGTPSQ
jgi:hypothetical protein